MREAGSPLFNLSPNQYMQSLSKNSKIDLANIKLQYEEQLEEKNQRIFRLESKNRQYLNIISQKE
jgi:hypothetical protein